MWAAAAPLLLLALTGAAPVCDAVWHDTARNRDVPVRIYMPQGMRPAWERVRAYHIILWSPGLGGSARAGAAWATSWTKSGFAVVAMAHPGSDAAVYAEAGSPEDRKARVVAGSNATQQLARIEDVRFVMDELVRRPSEGDCEIAELSRDDFAIAGHSMGAWTAQALAGQRFGDRQPFIDDRISAAVLMSSSGPVGAAGKAEFGDIGIPVMVITGTLDGVPPNASESAAATALAQRTAPYDGMPADGHKYLLVVGGAGHMMFSGKVLADTATPLERHTQQVVAALTSQFFGTWFLGDDDDAASIESARPWSLAPEDRYAHK